MTTTERPATRTDQPDATQLTRSVLAIVLREIRVQRRYPISMLNMVLFTPLYELAIPSLLLGRAFLVGGSAVGLSQYVGSTDLVGWLGVGVLAASVLVGSVVSVTDTMVADRTTGALEYSWSSTAPRSAFAVGGVITGSLFTLASSLLILTVGVAALGARYDPVGVLWCVPVLLFLLLGLFGLGFLASAVTLLMRRPNVVLQPVLAIMASFSGVAFPLNVLPDWARPPTYLMPTTWALDLMRHATLDTLTLAPVPVEIAALVTTSLTLLTVGRWVFRRVERKVCVSGILSQY